MKALLPLIISGALVVSGYAQTRNVLVGTNNAVVQPTNFWSADASNARTGLGLGVTDSANFSKLIVGNGAVTNLAIQVGTNNNGIYGSGSTLLFGVNGSAIASLSSSTLSVNGDILAVNAGQTRTNFGLVWEGLTNADASSFRTALGLGTAATNPASAFQASSANLTNLAANNGGSLTNLQATSLVGVIPASNISTVNFTNIGGTLSIASGGTSATNAANARQNLGSTTVGDAVFIATNAAAARTALGATTVGSSLFTLANPSAITFLRLNADNTATALSAADFRTALSLGTAATNLSSAFQPSSTVLSNLASSNGFNLTNLQASNVTGTIAISNGGSGATTAGGARTNLGLVLPALTNTNIDLFKSAIALGETDIVTFSELILRSGTNSSDIHFALDPTEMGLGVPIVFSFTNQTLNAAISRTNLGLGWSALTNTTASGFQTDLFGTGTNPVLVNTNGEVVSPTNFWQAAPINTVLQNITNVVGNATNAATNARMLFLYSLAPTVTNVTSTITLPTNGTTFGGDVATITHLGPTSSVTAIRALGAATNIITLNQIEESVRFIYRDNQWKLMDNISYIEPIFFSGTNAAANTAASRTNLGLGTTNTVNFARLELTDTTTNANLWIADGGEIEGDGDLFIGAGAVIFKSPIEFNNTTNAAATRTNLGIPLAALTNTSVTNFQKEIFYTNTAPSNIGGNLGTIAAWIEIVASNGVTYKIPAYTNVP